ncbi:TusE/DsrC/DsvC family sulfur relay protein [Marinicella sediminis]|uniref:Sulfurtransferase n=1 Tax=Marinicella sediminis TaxID=1792834 RepID=A0ABV7JFB3_9GAMM|nr:TusE/DsrC/DsvC family sulfur relay protein [Marinicella sediminis]
MKIATDQHGHLKHREDWNKSVAEWLAGSDDITLTDAHWAVIDAVRDIFELTGETPPMRLLIKALRQQLNEHIDSRYLYRLYPDGPVRLASKHAGLPKPKHCM